MISKIKEKIRRLLLGRYRSANAIQFGRVTYSQVGEDIVLCALLGGAATKGVYVDVGCNHPFRMSNTALLYEKGWSGIVIDPNPDFSPAFQKLRPRDKFVNCGIAEIPGKLHYHKFTEPLLNTFDPHLAYETSQRNFLSVESVEVKVRPLESVLNEEWPDGKEIQFMSIDCEGFDLQVLKSHNFEKYPVDAICVEIGKKRISACVTDPVSLYLDKKGYEQIAMLYNSGIFLQKELINEYGIIE